MTWRAPNGFELVGMLLFVALMVVIGWGILAAIGHTSSLSRRLKKEEGTNE